MGSKAETRAAFSSAFFVRNWQEIKKKFKNPRLSFCEKQCPVGQDVSGFSQCVSPAENRRREPKCGNTILHDAPLNQRVHFQIS